MRHYLERFMPVYAPEGDGGAAPPAGAPAGGTPPAGGTAPPPGDGGGQAQAGAPYRPEGLPDHLFDPNGEKGTIDRLWKAYDGYRQKDSTLGPMPDKPDGYAFEWSEPLKPYAETLKDDPFFGKVRAAGHKYGLRQNQLNGFLNEVLGEMVAGEMVEAPFDAKAERAGLVPEQAKGLSEQEQNAAVEARISGNLAWIEAMKARAPAETKDAVGKALDFLVAELGDRALGHQAIEFLKGQIGAGPQPAAGGQGGGGYTRADLQKRQADPRSNPMDPKHDPKFVEETQRLYQQVIGN